MNISFLSTLFVGSLSCENSKHGQEVGAPPFSFPQRYFLRSDVISALEEREGREDEIIQEILKMKLA